MLGFGIYLLTVPAFFVDQGNGDSLAFKGELYTSPRKCGRRRRRGGVEAALAYVCAKAGIGPELEVFNANVGIDR